MEKIFNFLKFMIDFVIDIMNFVGITMVVIVVILMMVITIVGEKRMEKIYEFLFTRMRKFFPSIFQSPQDKN